MENNNQGELNESFESVIQPLTNFVGYELKKIKTMELTGKIINILSIQREGR